VETIRRGAYQLWRVLIALLALAALTQFFLAGVGVFGADSFDAHEAVGHLMFIPASILLLILALVYWRERWVWIGSLLLGLDLFLQIILAGVGEDEPWVGAFHPVNALVVLGISSYLARRAWGLGWRPRTVEPAAAAGTTRDVA
jgi:hypothetical membrane protein